MASGTVERITNFCNELEKFTDKVVRLEKCVPVSICTDARNNYFAVEKNKPTRIPDNTELKQVRTRQSCPNKHTNRDKDFSNFSSIKHKACISDSVGQICVERVYFAASQEDTDLGNSQGNLYKHPYENQSSNYQLIETSKDRFSSESPKVNRRNDNEPSNLPPTNVFSMKIRPSKRGDQSLVTTGKLKNIQGDSLNCTECNKHGKLNAFYGTGGQTDIQMTSGFPHFAPKRECAYTATRSDTLEPISPAGTAASVYDQEQEVRYPFARSVDASCTQYTKKVSETNIISEGSKVNNSHVERDTKNDPPAITQPIHPKQLTFNAHRLSLPIGHQNKNQVTQGFQSTYQVSETLSSVQQEINSYSKSAVVFHCYNVQNAGSHRQQRQNLNRKVMQYWLHVDQALRGRQRTTEKQLNMHESQSRTIKNAAIIKPLAIRQRADRLDLRSGQYTEHSDTDGEVSIQTSSTKYSKSYRNVGLPAKKNNAPGFNVNGKLKENENFENQSLGSKDQKISIDSSNKQNVLYLNRRFSVSQDIPSRCVTESVTMPNKVFGSRKTVHMELNEQRNCFSKPTKFDVNVQVTTSQPSVAEKNSKSVLKITQATQASLDVTSSVNPPFYQDQKIISERGHLIQDADKYFVTNGAQGPDINKRKAENNESAAKTIKRMRPTSAPVEGAVKCNFSRSNSKTNAGQLNSVTPVDQYQVERDENCSANSQLSQGEKSDLLNSSVITHVKNRALSCDGHLDAQKKLKETYSKELQVCNGRGHLTSFMLKDAATMTCPVCQDTEPYSKNLVRVTELKSKLSQTVTKYKYPSQRKLFISKCVEAKLDLKREVRPQRTSVSCQASVELAPSIDISRPTRFLPKEQCSSAQLLSALPPNSTTLQSYSQSRTVNGNVSQATEKQNTIQEHCNGSKTDYTHLC